MDIERIEAVANAEMSARRDHGAREPGWILHHGRRTGNIARHLLDALGLDVDPEIVYVAGLFHDVGKGQDKHNEVGALRTRELLSGLVEADALEVICDAINSHNQRKGSDSLSECARLVQDADSIDHAGLIDVWMAFYWSGAHGESIHEHMAFFEGDDCARFRDYMRSHMNYDVSRQMLEERIQSADKFLSEFHRVYFEGI
ncbi:MAG: HD domain-containing protein [Lentisphaeria bacterium]|jgi:uncharacterized protein|nr:HD domain-containing protein [Lentisphaeria bacterium]